MKNKQGLLIIILVFVLLIGGAYGLYNFLGKDAAPDRLAVQATQPAEPKPTESAQESPQEETPDLMMAPDFAVYDAEGNEVHLEDFAGKPVVVNFWATWCTYCKMGMPAFEQAYQTQGEDIHFLMINMTHGQETIERAQELIAQEGYTFPVYYDTQMSAAMTYGVRSIPVTFFIDAQGHAIAGVSGAIDAETLQKGIDLIQ